MFRHTSQGDEYGIVVDDKRGDMTLLMGDGLCVLTPKEGWITIPWHGPQLIHQNATAATTPVPNLIPCCFVELLPVYEYASPDDIRVELQKVRNDFHDYEDEISSQGRSLGSLNLKLVDHENRLKRIEAIPDEVADRLAGS